MGVYSEYLDRRLDFQALSAERKAQLRRISDLRENRDILVYAADLTSPDYRTQIDYSDVMPFSDQMSYLTGTRLDLILETPGGYGEIAEKLVELLRQRYQEVSIIVPGQAMSSGTIMAMAGDEILMEPSSNLGPIDAQIFWQGKRFSAHALLAGFDKIKEEVEATGVLNLAYVPMLQNVSPGELENARNAQKFSSELVTKWLAEYKFRTWAQHSNGDLVTVEERQIRAQEIASALCDHGRWMSHGRAIKISDLESMRLKITDYSTDAALADAIRRYFILLRMTFEHPVYKLMETPTSQIYRFSQPVPAGVGNTSQDPNFAICDFTCDNCHATFQLFAALEVQSTPFPNTLPFPDNDRFQCPNCGVEEDLSQVRQEIESQTGKKVVTS